MPTTRAPTSEKATCQVSEGHRVLHDAMCRVIAGDGCRRDESGGNHEPQPERPDECEQEISGQKGCEAGHNSNGDSAEPSGACAIRPDARRDPCEQGKGVDREVEQETADDADGGDAGEHAE
jgi:hypothetical protein